MSKDCYILVGAQGAGKTTYRQASLPHCAAISQDEQGKVMHKEFFARALACGDSVVVDRINHKRAQREFYISEARKHGYKTHIVWLTTDREVCVERALTRTDHPTLAPTSVHQAIAMYYREFEPPTKDEADSFVMVGPNPFYAPVFDARELLKDKRYVIVGDLHGCYDELQELLTQLDFRRESDVAVFCGDLIDRGSKIKEVIQYIATLPEKLIVWGNHENKLFRYLRGNPIKINDGLQQTIDQIGLESIESTTSTFLRAWMSQEFEHIIQTPAGFVVHGGFSPSHPPHKQYKDTCMYARYVGGKDHQDATGDFWFKHWNPEWGNVFFGHIVLSPEEAPQGPTWGLDGGCVFGGELRAWDSRDGKVHSVKAKQAYCESYKKKETMSSPGSPLAAVAIREAYVKGGLLRADYSDDKTLAVYTYTDQCTYDGAWDEITNNSRGHVFNTQTGERVATPFSKFHNLGDRYTPVDSFDWTKPFNVYEKYDGWLATLYRHNGKFHISTRGSFHSTGAVLASSWIQKKDLSFLPDEVTLCFELLDPKHQIILKYDQPELVLLAAFNRHTGEEYSRMLVQQWGAKAGLTVAKRYEYSLEEMTGLQQVLSQTEGFVICFADGRRAKVKTVWYQRLSKILSTLSPISVWDIMVKGKVPQAYIDQLPLEVQPLASGYRDKLEQQYAQQFDEVLKKSNLYIGELDGDRKQMGLNLHHLSGPTKSAVFAVLADQMDKVHDIVKESIYPKGNNYAQI